MGSQVTFNITNTWEIKTSSGGYVFLGVSWSCISFLLETSVLYDCFSQLTITIKIFLVNIPLLLCANRKGNYVDIDSKTYYLTDAVPL